MCHVLVIEDDFLIADYIVQLVEAAGATSVSQAVTQQEAIDQARQRRPELIMSDVKLVEGTGPLAVKTILFELGPIPVIFVTGTPEDCEPCDARAVILGKPINEREVLHHFRQLAPV
ncbi:response regulator [Sphingomonas bacterium]|uniref:response regulator n=1 Tax=Sphingomonas bacterium TaxID=1895847 RepID=UPI0015757332|nr:response regulator [Sphingomonas bacterium]